MADEDLTETAIRKGREAEALLSSSVVDDAFDEVRRNIVAMLEGAALDDVNLRETVQSLKLVAKAKGEVLKVLTVRKGNMQVALDDLRVRQAAEEKAKELGQ